LINHVSFRNFTVYSVGLRISIHTFKCSQCNSLFKSFYLARCGVATTLKQHASHVRPSGQQCVLQEAQLSPCDRAMRRVSRNLANYHTTVQKLHTYPFNGPFSRTTQVRRVQKVKPMWILLKQQIVSGSRISWAICKSAPCSRQITTPTPHHSVFTGRMPT